MAHISESVPDLLGGVSQLAPQRRAVNEVESMVNCQLRPAEGVVKRPPTTWIAEIASSASAYNGAMVHTINKNADERFWVIVLDGDLKVFNAVTGATVPVSFPDGKTYLDVVGSPNEAFRLATFNDTTVIVNRETIVNRSSELSATRGFEALVTVQQTDYNTNYYIFVGFEGPPEFNELGIQIGPPRTRIHLNIPKEGGGPDGRDPDLSTIGAAFSLAIAISNEFGSLGKLINGTPDLLTTRLYGSTIHIIPGPDLEAGAEFWVSTADDLANQGLQLVQTSVQTIDNLPSDGPEGFRIKVEGDPAKSQDDVFYEFTEHKTWKETNASGIPIALDPSTLPLALIHDADLVTKNFPSQVPTATAVLGGETEYTTSWLQTEDGTNSTKAQAVISPSPGTQIDKFVNVLNANGGAIVMSVRLKLDQTHIVGPGPNPTDPTTFYAGDTHTIEIASDATGSYTNAFVFIVPFLPNARTFLLDITFGGALFDAGDNVRLRVISAANNLGALTVTTRGTGPLSTSQSVKYRVSEQTRISIPDSHYAPGTDMTFTLNSTGFVHDYVAGGTQAAYGALLVTAIEAYGGTAVTATFSVVNGRGRIEIVNDDGTLPVLTAFTFDDNLNSTIHYFNGGADFVTLGVTANGTIKNLTDVSEAIISGVATTVITHAVLAGGTENVWAKGDKGSATTSALSFTCREADWNKRLAGTEETNKWPSFENKKINEVAFLKNRLVLLSDENVAMSEVDKFFNFFRSSTLDILDSDRIDVALSGNKTSSLHTAFTWNKTLLVWSELGQFVVNGEPFLSPSTVTREATTAYINTRKVRPVTSERSVYFLTEGNEFCQLWDYRPTAEDATSAEGNRLSVQVPRYLPGTPRGLLAVSDPEMVLVLTATDPEKLYVYSHLMEDQNRIMGSWHEWDFAGVTQILGMGSIDNEVSLILERDDGKVHLEVLDLWELSEFTVDAKEETDDMAVPPTFDDEIHFQILIEDNFVSGSQIDLDTLYVPAPTPFGGTNWEVGEAGNTGYEVLTGLGVFDVGTGIASPARLNVNVDDDNLEISATFFQSALLTSAQSGALNLCMDEIAQGSDGIAARIQATIDGTFVTISLLDDDGLVTRTSSLIQHGYNMVTEGCMLTMRKVGTAITVWAADAITGSNSSLLTSYTLTSGEQSYYEDNAHRRIGFQCTGTQAGHYMCRALKVRRTTITLGIGTAITPSILGDALFSDLVAVAADGTETALTRQADGTLLFPTTDQTSNNLRVGIGVNSTIVLNKLYHRKNFGPYAGQAETRGQTYINNLLLGIEDTTTMQIAIAITGHTSFTQDLTEVRSLDAEYMHCRIGGRNTEITITLSSSDASNFKIVGFDWEGVYFNRTGRMS